MNPLPVVRWNADKRYLRDLAQRGVEIVPTVFLGQGEHEELALIAEREGWDELVLKPAVSASSYKTVLVRRGEMAAGQQHLESLLREGAALVQEFLPTVASECERSLVFFEGRYSHTILRAPALGLKADSETRLAPDNEEEQAFARAVLEAAGEMPLYARVDILRDVRRQLRLMELELIEPWLGLELHPEAADRFAQAIKARLDRQGPRLSAT